MTSQCKLVSGKNYSGKKSTLCTQICISASAFCANEQLNMVINISRSWHCNWPDLSCQHRRGVCDVVSAPRWMRFPAGSPPPASCTPLVLRAARGRARGRTDPHWHRRDRRWRVLAWTSLLRRTEWEAPSPWMPVRESPLAGAAGCELWPSTGLDGHPCCLPPATALACLHYWLEMSN